MSSFVAAALARVQDFLIEPPRRQTAATGGEGTTPGRGSSPAALSGLEVVVVGLRSGAGASTVARGLAVGLAGSLSRAGHVLAVGEPGTMAAGGLGGGSVWPIPAGLDEPGEVAEYGSMVSRLAGDRAALVWDVPPRQLERAVEVTRRADVVLVVARESESDPALAELVTTMLADRFGNAVLVANGVSEHGPWSGRAAVCLPEARWGALLAGRGRRPAGAFGAALEELSALVAGTRTT